MNGLDDAGDAVELRNRGFREVDLVSFLKNCKGVPRDRTAKKAQVIVDMVDLVRRFWNRVSWVNSRYIQVLDNGVLQKRKRKRCLKYLRKLCGAFGILPSSFTVEPTFDERETEPFAAGGFSHVYEATFNGQPVAVKTLKITTTANLEKVHKVNSSVPKTST